MNPVILIPARMGSTRLPGKMLADIKGLPVIVRVAKCALAADVAPVYVACDDVKIQEALKAHGIESVLTNPDLPSGSDRINQALKEIDSEGSFDVVVNVQGDLPNISPEAIKASLVPLQDKNIDISTLATKIHTAEDIENPNIVKIAMADVAEAPSNSTYKRALYFSRCPIPSGEAPKYHHVGLYAYKRAALNQFVTAPASPLEKSEKLEQLRALELGLRIGVAFIDEVPLSIDTQEDLDKARDVIN